MKRISREQAAIIGAYTGIAVGPFSDIQTYAERVLGRSVFTHEFANAALWAELRVVTREDLLSVAASKDEEIGDERLADPR